MDFIILASPVCFLIFLIYVIAGKIAKGSDSYSQVNKTHMKFYLLYLISVVYILFSSSDFTTINFVSFCIGSFIYFSLHYVYLFSLIGLAKKSISINILACIKELEIQKIPVTEESLTLYMNSKSIGIGDIRESRLKQMTGLGFATLSENGYSLTTHGKRVHYTGSLVLKIWSQKRL